MHHPHIAAALQSHAVEISSLREDPANVRRHPDRNLAIIEGSLRRFGQQTPIVVKDGIVMKGNATLRVARRLGWTHIAAVTTELDAAALAAYGIADNRSGETSEWDEEALRSMLGALPEDLRGAAGFDQVEFGELLRGHEAGRAIEDDIPATPARAFSARGDVWLLGQHRLLCGDSCDPADVARVMDGRTAALVSTDPPYLVDYTGARPNGTGKDWSAVYHEIDIKDADGFFRALFTNAKAVMAPHSAIYCWHAHRRCGLIQRIWEELGILDHQQVIWVKPTPVFGRVFWHYRHEPCMMGWVQGSMPEHDGQHKIDSVWEVASDELSVWYLGWEGKARIVGNEHPTQKPVEIFARPIRKHTIVGDVVFEPFSGSGSQLIAAEQLARRCFAIEIEPVFVDVAITRWQNFTSRPATLEQTGQTYAEVSALRKSTPPVS